MVEIADGIIARQSGFEHLYTRLVVSHRCAIDFVDPAVIPAAHDKAGGVAGGDAVGVSRPSGVARFDEEVEPDGVSWGVLGAGSPRLGQNVEIADGVVVCQTSLQDLYDRLVKFYRCVVDLVYLAVIPRYCMDWHRH